DFDALTGSVHGRGAADLRAARIGVKVSFALRDDAAAAAATTLVKIVSDAELGGGLADFARTGGIAVAHVIMADFPRRAAEEFAKDAVPETPTAAEAAPAPEPLPLSAHSLLWVAVKAQLIAAGRWVVRLLSFGHSPGRSGSG